MRKSGFTLIELMLVVTIIGILAATAIPFFHGVHNRAKEARVRSNCHAVQLAAEDFAVQNGGIYASDTDTDVSDAGTTIIDLLDSGALLENPFTLVLSEPQSSGAADSPGETGYVPIVGPSGLNEGYAITGFGKTGIVGTYTNGS